MEKKSSGQDNYFLITDEIFNTVSHFGGFIFAIFILILLLIKAQIAGKFYHIISFYIYGISLIAVFFASSLNHWFKHKKNRKKILEVIDYSAIFLLIAGTYTPFCLVLLRNPLGLTIFGINWGIAIIGIIIVFIFPDIPSWITNTVYISMGWIGIILLKMLLKSIGFTGVFYLLLGGFFYTTGSFIYYFKKPNFIQGKFGHHEIWHICVLIGAVMHAFVIYNYILPAD
jgi:hemolysin III